MNSAVKSAVRVLDLLEFFSVSEEPMGVSELSRLMLIPKSSMQALLGTLVARGYLERVPGGYQLSTQQKEQGWVGGALARLRKFGGRCVLGFQSIAQVSGTYGEADARTIVENCATTLILRTSASEGGGTARFASQLIGQREVERVQETRSQGERDGSERVSHARQVALELALLPAEIEALPDLEGYLKLASNPVWRRIRLAPRPH